MSTNCKEFNALDTHILWFETKSSLLNLQSQDSSVGITTDNGLDNWMIRFESWKGLGIFLFTIVSRLALGPTQPPIPGVKQPWHEANHSLPSSAEVKECVELYPHTPNTSSWGSA
jgi:hypothetical protein